MLMRNELEHVLREALLKWSLLNWTFNNRQYIILISHSDNSNIIEVCIKYENLNAQISCYWRLDTYGTHISNIIMFMAVYGEIMMEPIQWPVY